MNDDTLLCIFDYLQLNDIAECFTVCKLFNKSANNSFYWKRLLDKDFLILENHNCKDLYRQYFNLNKFTLTKLKFHAAWIYADTNFDFKRYNISQLPPEISLLTNLTSLDFQDNQLRTLPAEIGYMTNLRFINLELNDLEILPPEFFKLTNLESLYLSYNYLTSISNVTMLTNLIHLYIGNNNINNVRETMLLSNLTRLQSIGIHDDNENLLPFHMRDLILPNLIYMGPPRKYKN